MFWNKIEQNTSAAHYRRAITLSFVGSPQAPESCVKRRKHRTNVLRERYNSRSKATSNSMEHKYIGKFWCMVQVLQVWYVKASHGSAAMAST